MGQASHILFYGAAAPTPWTAKNLIYCVTITVTALVGHLLRVTRHASQSAAANSEHELRTLLFFLIFPVIPKWQSPHQRPFSSCLETVV